VLPKQKAYSVHLQNWNKSKFGCVLCISHGQPHQ